MTHGVHHFFVAPGDFHNGVVEITGEEARHAARVLRVRVGEQITVADDTGRVVHAVVSAVGAIVRASIEHEAMVEPATPQIVLVQAVAKGDRMDDVISKGVEVGVSRITPFIAERSIIRWDASRARKARDRWTSVARSAAKQSRSARLTIIDEVGFGLPEVDGPATVALHEAGETRLRDVLPATAPQTLTLIVGPEGGLTDSELEALGRGGARIVTLGERVLRTETAGLVAATIVAHVYGSLG